ncbi:MAG: flagellin [Hyphomicrobiales bacterium]|nr:flagellin [Hyphomicrobiales bacterium]
MSSLLTNTSALNALRNLSLTQQSLQTTQNQISTGLKVASAADNASYWSIATQMRSDNSALGAVKDALNTSGALLDTMSAGITSSIGVMNKIKDNLVAASQPGADTAKIATELKSLGAQLASITSASNFNGINLLDGSAGTTVKFVASFSASTVGTIDVGTKDLVNAGAGLLDAATAGTTTTNFTDGSADLTSANIADTIKNADKAISDLTSYAATLGSVRSQVTDQGNFISTLSDSLTKGVSSLVDADMNEASTKLQALQTQQQLGVQSLSIANQNTQMILKLFQ